MLSRLHLMYPQTVAIALLFNESSLYGFCGIDEFIFLFALFFRAMDLRCFVVIVSAAVGPL